MNVLHFCLSNIFVDGVLYQENELVFAHVQQGHNVLVVASTETYDEKGSIAYVSPGIYNSSEGAEVVRLSYRKWMPHGLARRVRSYPGVYRILKEFSPDAIVFHGSSSWELTTVSRYVKERSNVAFYIDSHADFVNSAKTKISRLLLHQMFYGPILRKAMLASGPLLCVAQSTMEFAQEVYRISADRIEMYPLGGRIPSSVEYISMRNEVRSFFSLEEEDILIVQSGKQNADKKLVSSLIEINALKRNDIYFFIAGVIQDDIKEQVERLVSQNENIKYLGWQTSESLTKLLCAADVYLQPGTQSVTMQHSLCCSCAVIIDDIPGHRFYLQDTGWAISDSSSISSIISSLTTQELENKKLAALSFAKRFLDYQILGRRVLQPNDKYGR